MKTWAYYFLCAAISVLFISVDVLAKEIGVAWVGKAGMPERVIEGFAQGLNDLEPVIKFNIEYQKDLPSEKEFTQVVRRFEKEKDAMVLLRSSSAKWLADNKTSIPTFIGACNNPVQLGAVSQMERPGGNITGVTYYIPASTHIEIFKAMQPDMSSIFLLTEKDHPGSWIDELETKGACARLGIAYNGKMCGSLDDISETIRQNKDKVSALIMGPEALITDNTTLILKTAGMSPVYTYSEGPIKEGALAGYVADEGKLGLMLAESVIAVLVKGMNIGEIPIKTDPVPTLYVNGTTYQKIGVKIPAKILSLAKIIQ